MDVTKIGKDQIDKYAQWISNYHLQPETCVVCLAFTKTDLNYNSANLKEIEEYAKSKGWLVVHTSSKENTGVQECFTVILDELIDNTVMAEREETIQEQEGEYGSFYSSGSEGSNSNQGLLAPFKNGIGSRSQVFRKKSEEVETWELETPRNKVPNTNRKIDNGGSNREGKMDKDENENMVDTGTTIWQRIRYFCCLEPEDNNKEEKEAEEG